MGKRHENIRSTIDPRNIPSELDQFLQHDAFSLVIKGKAGTGKTALALTILSKSIGKQNSLYISSRLSISELFQYYPWVQDFVDGSNKDRPTEAPESNIEIAPFVDARLDEPSALFERITNELMDTSSPLIIIDTWDAVGDFMDREALITNAKILQIWRQRSRAKLVFVLESVEDKTFDNLVDGVIDLEEKYLESRKTRRIHLSKLRGVKITKPWNFFTLDKGVFHSFDPYNSLEPLSLPRPIMKGIGEAPLPNGKKGSLASNTLENLLSGSIPQHVVASLELDPGVNPKVALVFLAGIIASYAKKDKVLLLPPKGIATAYIDQLLKMILRSSEQRKRVEVLKNSPITGSQPSQIVDNLKKTIAQIKRKDPKAELIGVLSLGPSLSKGALDLDLLKTTITSDIEASVLITFSSEAVTQKILDITDIRLRIREIEGTLFIQPEKPWASFYGIENDKDSGIISVLPMV